jgi:hypothetical protein
MDGLIGQWVGSAHSLFEIVSALPSLIFFGEIQHELDFYTLKAPFPTSILEYVVATHTTKDECISRFKHALR